MFEEFIRRIEVETRVGGQKDQNQDRDGDQMPSVSWFSFMSRANTHAGCARYVTALVSAARIESATGSQPINGYPIGISSGRTGGDRSAFRSRLYPRHKER